MFLISVKSLQKKKLIYSRMAKDNNSSTGNVPENIVSVNGSNSGVSNNNNNKNNGKKNKKREHRCHVCGRKASEVAAIYKGEFDEDCYICNDCIEQLHLLNQALAAKYNRELDPEHAFKNNDEDDYIVDLSKKIPTPKEIVKYLNKHIIGQDKAKRDIAVAVYNHMKMIYAPEDKNPDAVQLRTNNIMCMGPSGSGKTEICRRLAEYLDIPFVIFDISSVTQAGYVGEDLDVCLQRVLNHPMVDGDIEKAQRSMIMIDEFDKISRNTHYDKTNNGDHKSQINSLGVQSQLLKYLDGGDVTVQLTRNGGERFITINTSKILFVLNGAFVGMDGVIGDRLNRKSAIGFDLKNNTAEKKREKKIDDENILKYVKPTDVVAYGFLPEIVGRAGNITYTNALSRDDLKRVLTEPQNSIIKEYKKRLALDGKELSFTEDALDWICDDAISNETGARGLSASVNKIMSNIMFDAPDNKDVKNIVIDLAYINSVVEESEEEIEQKKRLRLKA